MSKRQKPTFAVFMLMWKLFEIGTDYIPPFTLASTIGMMFLYLDVWQMFPDILELCGSNLKILHFSEYYRILTASFFHSDDIHLYYNMLSYLYKGITLETRVGTPHFAVIIVAFSVLSQIVLLVCNYILYTITGWKYFVNSCAIGFSAVIYGLKPVIGGYFENSGSFGPFPSVFRYFLFLEPVLLTGNVSFVGHLSGVLVGLMYTRGPLKKILYSISSLIPNIQR